MSDSDDDEPPLLVNLDETNDRSLQQQQEVEIGKEESNLPPCPVTILSGFLGSGKTTLIQYILRSPHHKKRIAVIENEFGEGLAIESLIARSGIDDANLTDLIELPNGCVCCTVKDSLVETLEGLLAKRKDLDYILIEASGLANPGPIASVFWLDEQLESRLRLDGVVTLVDAYHITQQLNETQEASQQIAYADRILLNKTDLVLDTVDITIIQTTLRAMNPAAQIKTTTYSEVPDLDWILDAHCYDQNRKTEEFSRTVEQVVGELDNENDHNHSHEHEHGHEHNNCSKCKQAVHNLDHSHTGAVSTIAFTKEGTMDLEKANAWLASTLWPNQDEKDEILRARLEKSLKENSVLEASASGGIEDTRTAGDEQEQQIFRIKGVLSVKCNKDKVEEKEWAFCDPGTGIDRRRYIIQAVYDLWEIQGSNDIFNLEEERECKLVIIGRHLRREDLKRGFQSCFI